MWWRRRSCKLAAVRSLQCRIPHVRITSNFDELESTVVGTLLTSSILAVHTIKTTEILTKLLSLSLLILLYLFYSIIHSYCLEPPLRAVPTGDWFCGMYNATCRSHNHNIQCNGSMPILNFDSWCRSTTSIILTQQETTHHAMFFSLSSQKWHKRSVLAADCKARLERFDEDGLEALVNALSPSFTSRFGEVCWAQGGAFHYCITAMYLIGWKSFLRNNGKLTFRNFNFLWTLRNLSARSGVWLVGKLSIKLCCFLGWFQYFFRVWRGTNRTFCGNKILNSIFQTLSCD